VQSKIYKKEINYKDTII